MSPLLFWVNAIDAVLFLCYSHDSYWFHVSVYKDVVFTSLCLDLVLATLLLFLDLVEILCLFNIFLLLRESYSGIRLKKREKVTQEKALFTAKAKFSFHVSVQSVVCFFFHVEYASL